MVSDGAMGIAGGSKLLILQPRTAEGAPLAFSLADLAGGEDLQTLVQEMFRDHRTAVTVEVFADEALLEIFARPPDGPSDPAA